MRLSRKLPFALAPSYKFSATSRGDLTRPGVVLEFELPGWSADEDSLWLPVEFLESCARILCWAKYCSGNMPGGMFGPPARKGVGMNGDGPQKLKGCANGMCGIPSINAGIFMPLGVPDIAGLGALKVFWGLIRGFLSGVAGDRIDDEPEAGASFALSSDCFWSLQRKCNIAN